MTHFKNVIRDVNHLKLQWNPDFSNTRLFETPDSSNQKSFPLDLLQSNTVILPPDFSNARFFELPISRTNFHFPFRGPKNRNSTVSLFTVLAVYVSKHR